jgi:carboxyl-terminal processing protease
MRRLALLLAFTVVACTSAPSGTPEPSVPATSLPSVTTTSTTSTTTVAVDVAYEVRGCNTPPVTFALLCDVFELLNDHHVDAPLDAATLAAGAALGVDGYEGELAEEPAATFVCAIPDPAFETTCETLARRLESRPIDMLAAVEAGVASMISLSLDPFTYYIPPELSGALTEDGIVTAVGLLLTIIDPVGSRCTVIQAGCRLEVTTAFADGPAYEAGLRAGDVIVAIDGTDVAGSTLVDVAALLDGEEDTMVGVEVVDGDQTTEYLVRRSTPSYPELGIEVPAPGVGYIRVPDFEADIPAFLHGGLASLDEAGIDELVLDLRDNPGGYVDVATLVASEFLEGGLVFKSESPTENLDYPVQEGGLATSGTDITVVVNSGSASASEILAGVLQERGRATIVGEPTHGKNTVQIAFPLRNDGQLRVTIARWVTPAGTSVAGTGVVPDIAIDIPPEATPAEVVELVTG